MARLALVGKGGPSRVLEIVEDGEKSWKVPDKVLRWVECPPEVTTRSIFDGEDAFKEPASTAPTSPDHPRHAAFQLHQTQPDALAVLEAAVLALLDEGALEERRLPANARALLEQRADWRS